MKVQEAMTSDAKSCRPTTNLAEAGAIMWEHNCGTLPVVDSEDRVIGMITDRDLCMAAATRNRLASDMAVGEVVSGKVYACAPEDDVKSALKTMEQHQVRRLPVLTNNGRLAGILSLDDVVIQAQEGNGKQTHEFSYADVLRTLKVICAHRALRAEERRHPAQRDECRWIRLKSDEQLRREVLDELKWDSRVEESGIKVEVNNGIVTLTGTAPTYAGFLAAQEAAHRVAGVLDVANDIQVNVLGTLIRSDTDIAQAVRHALAWDVLVPEEQIQSTVSNGWVTLEGSVESLREREEAERAVRRLAGVRDVRNKIAVNPPKADRGDVLQAIEEALARCAKHEAEHIQVTVSDGIATLSGWVSSGFEKRTIIETVSHAPGIRSINDQLRIEHHD